MNVFQNGNGIAAQAGANGFYIFFFGDDFLIQQTEIRIVVMDQSVDADHVAVGCPQRTLGVVTIDLQRIAVGVGQQPPAAG